MRRTAPIVPLRQGEASLVVQLPFQRYTNLSDRLLTLLTLSCLYSFVYVYQNRPYLEKLTSSAGTGLSTVHGEFTEPAPIRGLFRLSGKTKAALEGLLHAV
jgi:hypothetical protein